MNKSKLSAKFIKLFFSFCMEMLRDWLVSHCEKEQRYDRAVAEEKFKTWWQEVTEESEGKYPKEGKLV
jgi:hypothetical protein